MPPCLIASPHVLIDKPSLRTFSSSATECSSGTTGERMTSGHVLLHSYSKTILLLRTTFFCLCHKQGCWNWIKPTHNTRYSSLYPSRHLQCFVAHRPSLLGWLKGVMPTCSSEAVVENRGSLVLLVKLYPAPISKLVANDVEDQSCHSVSPGRMHTCATQIKERLKWTLSHAIKIYPSILAICADKFQWTGLGQFGKDVSVG